MMRYFFSITVLILYFQCDMVNPMAKKPIYELPPAKEGYLKLKVLLDGTEVNGTAYPEAYYLVTRNHFRIAGGRLDQQGMATIFLSSGNYTVQAVIEQGKRLIARAQKELLLKTSEQWLIFNLKSQPK